MIGLLTLLSLMTSLSGGLTQAWAGFLHRWIGWGAYALTCFAFDRSLVFAFKDGSLSGVSSERIFGIILLFFNLLILFQLLDASFGSLSTPPGGGILGGALYRGLESGLGKAGTGIVLIAWLLVALVLLIDLSMSDLVNWLAEKYKHSHSKFANFLRKKAEAHRLKAEKSQDLAELEQNEKVIIQTSPVESSLSSSASTTTETESRAPEKSWIMPVPEEILNPVQKAPIDEESDEVRRA